MSLFTVTVNSGYHKIQPCFSCKPEDLKKKCSPKQSCQIFSPSYWQNLNKNCHNGCFFKKLRQKLPNVLTMVIYIFMGVSKCFGRQCIFCRKDLCQRSKIWL